MKGSILKYWELWLYSCIPLHARLKFNQTRLTEALHFECNTFSKCNVKRDNLEVTPSQYVILWFVINLVGNT